MIAQAADSPRRNRNRHVCKKFKLNNRGGSKNGPDSKHALNVIPHSHTEAGRVDAFATAHCMIGQIIRGFEFVVQVISDVVVQ